MAWVLSATRNSLETNKRLANKLSDLYFYSLPEDNLDNYISRMDKINVDDIFEISKEYYSDNNLAITVLGDSKKILKDFQSLGKIKTLKSENAFA